MAWLVLAGVWLGVAVAFGGVDVDLLGVTLVADAVGVVAGHGPGAGLLGAPLADEYCGFRR